MNFELAIIGTTPAIKSTVKKITLLMDGLGCSFDQNYTHRRYWSLSKKSALNLSCVHLRIHGAVTNRIHREQVKVFMTQVKKIPWVHLKCYECLKHRDWEKHQDELLAALAR